MKDFRHPGQSPDNAQRQLTLGEYRVGLNFNPSGDAAVAEIKARAAAFIDLCEALKATVPHIVAADGKSAIPCGEALRLIALAQTHIEDAAMWAVKAATKKPR